MWNVGGIVSIEHGSFYTLRLVRYTAGRTIRGCGHQRLAAVAASGRRGREGMPDGFVAVVAMPTARDPFPDVGPALRRIWW